MIENDEIVKLRAALDEVFKKRGAFSESTYTQVIMALYDKMRRAQTTSDTPDTLFAEKPDEIRLVTIMFVDVVDSTAMSRVMDADDWKRTIGTAHQHIGRVVQKWGGVIGQYLGDGMLCFFGAAHSQEDDAIRAVYCALQIHDTIARNADNLFDREDMTFQIRIGMSTGRVVVGLFGDEANRTMLALGTPTNLAARLQNIAQPGETLVDAQTYRRIRNHFTTEARPVTKIKGFDYPIEHHSVLARRVQRPTQLTSNQVANIETAFVGRAAERARLKRIFQDCLEESRLAAVIIYGDIGLGKSRLLQEILYMVADLSFNQMTLVGNYQKQAISYGLLQDFLTARCNLREDTPPQIVEQRIVAYIHESWPHPEAEATAHAIGFLAGLGFDNSPHVRPFRQRSPEQQRLAFSTITRWIRGQAEAGPLLLAVDNLQWVDNESLQLLEHVANDLEALPAVVCATARPEFRDSRPEYLAKVPVRHQIELEALSDREIDSIVQTIFEHIERTPEPLLAQIRSRAEGNPLFVEEFVYMLFDNGIIEADDEGEWRVNEFLYSALSSNLPSGLVALLQARLDELSPSTRQVIQIASVIGSTFWPGAVNRSLDSADVMEQALSDLQGRGIIQRQTDSDFEREPEYQFRHILYRDVVYSMLPRQNREAYHHNVATWLEDRVAQRPDYLGMLADHYLKSHLYAEALGAFVRAAQERYLRGLLGEALSLIETGLEVSRKVNPTDALPEVSELWLLQGQVYNAMDRYEESSAASESALRLMSEAADEAMLEQKAHAARTLGSAQLSLGHYDEAFNVLNRAHSLLPKDNIVQHAAVMRTFGNLFLARGQLNESLAYQQEAYTLAQQSDDPREVARVMAALSSISLDRGDFGTALAYCERVLAMNREADNIYYQILDLRQMASIYRLLTDYETALALCDEAEELQKSIRYRDHLLQMNRALCLIATGQTDDGLTLLRETADIEHENTITQQTLQLALMNGLSMVGDYKQCDALATRFMREVDQNNKIMIGRGQLWQGIAQNGLSDIRAMSTLKRALDSELEYGGRDAWICYYALGTASVNPTVARKWFDNALAVLQATASSLHTRPNLRAKMLENDLVRWLTGMVQSADDLAREA